MTKQERPDSEDLRAAAQLIVEATVGVTRVVESMHQTIGSGPRILGRPLRIPVRLAIAPFYGAVRGVTQLAGVAVDRVIAQLSPLLSERVPGPQRLALLAALNGVLGDRLEETRNPLALSMGLFREGHEIPLEREALRAHFPRAGRRIVVLVHGSSLNDLQWERSGHDHGAALARDLGCVPLYLRYNTGRNISKNGRQLAGLLESLVSAWPDEIEELILLGHSMGGLVSRSACVTGEREDHAWRKRLTRMAFLGSPHHGAPLERAGNWVDFLLEISAYSAPLAVLGKIRSAGVTDLRYGNICDEDWMGHDRFQKRPDDRIVLPLPQDVRCYAVAGTKSTEKMKPLRTDGLVPVESALGKHKRANRTLSFREEDCFVARGTDHLGLLASSAAYSALREWFGASAQTS